MANDELMRKSQATDGGQNTYSDFEEDEDPAVGSGIMETDEKTEEEEEYDDFDNENQEMNETASIKREGEAIPEGQIAQLEEATESEYSEDLPNHEEQSA